MKLKKINAQLQEALIEQGFETPTNLQEDSFGTIKSGLDAVILAGSEEGKTTTLAINVIQKLEREHLIATRALIVVANQTKVVELVELMERLSKYTDLRIYGVHEHTDLDNDKNMLSAGNDILIGTTDRLNEMFSSAGFDVNQLKMYIVDDVDQLLRLRLDTKLLRLSESIGKTQRLYFGTKTQERLEFFVEKSMQENAVWFEYE